MKPVNLIKCIATAALLCAFASCSKSSGSGSSSSASDNSKVQADDQTFYTNETDYATNDVNVALNGDGGSYNQRPESPTPLPIPWPCDTTSVIVDTTSTHSITITYSGSSCGTAYNHKRSGTIVATFNPNFKWGTAGAALTITFDLNVTRLSDGKKMTISGTRVITNATGGLLRNFISLTPPDSIAYTITDNTTVTFDNGSQRSWQTSLRRTFTLDNTGAVITTIGSLSGTNRYGDSFSTAITEPLVVTQCSGFRYTSGQVSYTGALGGTSTTTFGLDSNGNPTTGCQTGVLYYKFVWIGPNNGKLTSTGGY